MGVQGNHIRFGKVKGTELNIGGLRWLASQVIANQSGKFVFMSSTGYLTLCTGDAGIMGWAQEPAGTPTVGDLTTVNISKEAVYRVPIITGTYAVTMIGESCDLVVSSSVQGVDLTAGTYDNVIIVGGDLTNQNYVDVVINPANEMSEDAAVA